jgi:hypothetical protein
MDRNMDQVAPVHKSLADTQELAERLGLAPGWRMAAVQEMRQEQVPPECNLDSTAVVVARRLNCWMNQSWKRAQLVKSQQPY